MSSGMGYNWPNAVVTYVNHWDQQSTTYANRARPFQVAASHGVTVMRTFFGTVDSITATKSATTAVSNQAWADLTELLDTAAANGVKLILSNYLTQETIQALSGTTYASWANARVALTTSGSSAWNGLQSWMTACLTRFANHPGVFSWEATNEPGFMLGMDDASITRDSGCAFLNHFQSYLKTNGAHLVNSGGRALFDKSQLTDAQAIAATQDLDYLDDHWYPTGGDTAATHLAGMDTWVARVRTLLGRPAMPVLIGEFGTNPQSFFDAVTDGILARGWLPIPWGYDSFDSHEFNETLEPYVLTRIATVNTPAVTVTSAAVGARRNLSPNPSLKVNVTGNGTDWTSSPTGYARQTGVTSMDRTTGFGGSGAKDIITTPRFAAVAGAQYMASVQVKTGASNTFKMLVNWYTGTASGSTFISNSGTTNTFTVNGTQRCEVGPFTAPVGAGGGYLRIIELDNTTVTLAALLVEQTNVSGSTYFDGDTPAASWEGVAGNSTSALLVGADAFALADVGTKVQSAVGPVGGDAAALVESASVAASGIVNQDVAFRDGGMVIALAYDARRGRNRISAFGLPAAAIRAEVSVRPAGRTAFTPVRGGKVAAGGGTFAHAVDDYEFAAGVANTYRIRALSSQENVPDVVVTSATATLPAVLDDVWLKFIAQPALNRRVTLTDWSEITRASRVALYEVQNRSDPIAVTDVHSSRRVTVTLRTATVDEGDALDQALGQGLPLFLHTPVVVAMPSLYAVAGDYGYSRPNARSVARLWTVPLTEVSPPPLSVVGAASTCQSILDAYGSCQDVLDAFATCQDLVS